VITIQHSNGEQYEGEVVREDDLRLWLQVSTGKVLCIWKKDIKETK
jgi:hypothetical protein